jgi:hypothetical protein
MGNVGAYAKTCVSKDVASGPGFHMRGHGWLEEGKVEGCLKIHPHRKYCVDNNTIPDPKYFASENRF